MDLVAATADGGVTINDFQQGLVPLDANGTAGTPSGNSLLAVTPWALGNWMGDPTGALAEFAGPPTDISLSPWFQPEGNRQSQHQPQKPTIAHFVPATPSDLGIESYDAFTGGMTDVDVVPRSKADHVFYMGTKATPEGFLATLANPIAAVGFIGHSFDIFASPPFSVGLNFSTTASALVRPSSPTDNPQYTITAPNTRLVTVSQIHSQAKLIFIGACFSGPAFESLWNLQGGQAMVVLSNPSSTVLLGHALAAWERILEDMVNKHMAAGAAVSETDTFLPRIGVPEQYKVIGDPRVQITP
jgi:hypothetical protein